MSGSDLEHSLREQLTAPGAPFEMVVEDVLGVPMRVFKERKRSLRELLEGSAVHGDAEYVVDGSERLSYAEHLARAAALAHVLRDEYGIREGDRIAIFAANCAEWAIAFWATVSVGGIVSAMNGWWTADEFSHAWALCEPSLLIGDRKRLERIDVAALGKPVLEIESDIRSAHIHGVAPTSTDRTFPDATIAEDDPAVILFTSGTTGRSKGAVNSHRSLCGFIQSSIYNGAVGALAERARQGEDATENPTGGKQIVLITSPMFHLSALHGSVLLQLQLGGCLVLLPGRFDPEEALETIERERVTLWPALGSAAPRVAAHPRRADFDLSSVQSIGIGGAPVSPSVQDVLREAFPSAALGLRMGYTSSEAVGIVANIGGADYRDNPTAAGRLWDGVEVEIRGEGNRVVAEGVEGEIHVRSPYTMLEYWRNPEATRATIKPSRWLAMGDIGSLEGDLLTINSRARDMILVNAENVYPVEVEYRLDAHPAVAECAVIGVDDALSGQAVKAVVVLSESGAASERELEAWCRKGLAPYKIPTQWEFRSAPLPRNPTGKVLKTALLGEDVARFTDVEPETVEEPA